MCNDLERRLLFIQGGKWLPDRSGGYEANCQRGREFADEMMLLIGELDNPSIFGSIVRAIMDAGRFEGVEVGFCSQIGIVVLANTNAYAASLSK